ncbi:uncharacterized protein LOC116766276 [Danaus plexippus]|uniref:uncharacterized protein LOC116766276 n=1 Tax=Danaus plexippus TaxID=13037 RepID=UPI002AB15DD1|nr:uncharacterized protein LOC116766276 [Danaus plexippus]
MPFLEAPSVDLGSAPRTPSVVISPTPSEVSSASSPEPQNVRATPLFRALAMRPPEPEQPPGQDELERRLPGYRRIVIPRELTLIELLKQCSGVNTDEEVLSIREAKLRVVAERVGLRRLHVLVPHLKSLILDGSALTSLRDLGIGLVHLKKLSVSRCGLTSLDGVWGLNSLRELHASGNRLKDFHQLAALQKLHTLDLADNLIEESNRLWTLGVCNALRKLTLRGSPIADIINYRSVVASALPMLNVLDDSPLNTYEDEYIPEEGSDSSESDVDAEAAASQTLSDEKEHQMSQAGPSTDTIQDEVIRSQVPTRRRPATTECGGQRPQRPEIKRRPRTALERTIDSCTRLQIMNTLMDDEWCSAGSKLTSYNAVGGNIARAVRGAARNKLRDSVEAELQLVSQSMEADSRALAAEIPRAPEPTQWDRFRLETGIEIDIDFNKRPKDVDPSKVLDRIERIEKETMERLGRPDQADVAGYSPLMSDTSRIFTGIRDDDLWKQIEDLKVSSDPPTNIDELFKNIIP